MIKLGSSVSIKIVNAWQIFSHPKLESLLMGLDILVGPLNMLIIGVGKSFASHGEVLDNMSREDVHLEISIDD